MIRIYHPWWKWECFKAGFYSTTAPNQMSADDAREAYAVFLGNLRGFRAAMDRVVAEWPISCEQFLSNDGINRVAWLGQSSMCIENGIPACFRGGFKLLSPRARSKANAAAAERLNVWLHSSGSLF